MWSKINPLLLCALAGLCSATAFAKPVVLHLLPASPASTSRDAELIHTEHNQIMSQLGADVKWITLTGLSTADLAAHHRTLANALAPDDVISQVILTSHGTDIWMQTSRFLGMSGRGVGRWLSKLLTNHAYSSHLSVYILSCKSAAFVPFLNNFHRAFSLAFFSSLKRLKSGIQELEVIAHNYSTYSIGVVINSTADTADIHQRLSTETVSQFIASPIARVFYNNSIASVLTRLATTVYFLKFIKELSYDPTIYPWLKATATTLLLVYGAFEFKRLLTGAHIPASGVVTRLILNSEGEFRYTAPIRPLIRAMYKKMGAHCSTLLVP